jgi:hypothetical protein
MSTLIHIEQYNPIQHKIARRKKKGRNNTQDFHFVVIQLADQMEKGEMKRLAEISVNYQSTEMRGSCSPLPISALASAVRLRSLKVAIIFSAAATALL